ncbi:gamma adaptin ear containing, arf binding protein [Saguinus oedipus]|uniref:Gamma adaptin ear containing, arf binding protein n=1 Tax=Saguinus oedipus TaxID=9490 RepID=A0ABQ9VRQ0_SAGOE|nr:gamma adaptin ear containing, arf binding protein [Saguinus oedipus]
MALPEEAKIKDAYHMLKRQGIVQSDPPIPMDRMLIPSPPPRPKNPVFDDEEKSKLLAKLLKSKNPDDLQEANKLIKSMVKEVSGPWYFRHRVEKPMTTQQKPLLPAALPLPQRLRVVGGAQ